MSPGGTGWISSIKFVTEIAVEDEMVLMTADRPQVASWSVVTLKAQFGLTSPCAQWHYHARSRTGMYEMRQTIWWFIFGNLIELLILYQKNLTNKYGDVFHPLEVEVKIDNSNLIKYYISIYRYISPKQIKINLDLSKFQNSSQGDTGVSKGKLRF